MNATQMGPPSKMNSFALKKVIVYLVVTFTLCIPFYYSIISSGEVEVGGGIYIIGLMWCPGIAALLTRFAFQRNLQGMGWGWGKTRYLVGSYLLPLMAMLAVYGITWATGLGGFSGAELTGDTGPGCDSYQGVSGRWSSCMPATTSLKGSSTNSVWIAAIPNM